MSDRKYTRAEIRCQVIRLAKSLSTVYGIKEGDVIGIYCENRLEFPVIVFAAFCLGATVAPLNVTYTDRMYFDFYLRAVNYVMAHGFIKFNSISNHIHVSFLRSIM